MIFRNIGFVFLLGMLSCSNAPENLAQFETWFEQEENGYASSRKHEHIVIKATYTPADLMAINEVKNLSDPAQTTIDSLVKTYEGSTYFVIELGIPEEQVLQGDVITETRVVTREKYNDDINKLSFQMDRKVFLVSNGDTIRPTIYQYERGYELGKKEKMIFMFPKVPETSNVELNYVDDIFETGINKFLFKIADNKHPKLNKDILS